MYCIYLKSSWGPAFKSSYFFSTELVAIVSVWRSLCQIHESTCGHQFFHSECLNLAISQHQHGNSSYPFWQVKKFYRRAAVVICSCKGDFKNSCFLQRTTFSEYLICSWLSFEVLRGTFLSTKICKGNVFFSKHQFQ